MEEMVGSLRDLSEEGLDLLLRVGLKTSTRFVGNAVAMDELVAAKSIEVHQLDEALWQACLGDLEEFGRDAWSAIAGVIIRECFPEEPAFRMPKVGAAEIFRTDYLEGPMGFSSKLALRRERSDKIDIAIFYPGS